MPVAKVQLSDGRIARFEVPEGTTQDQVMAEARKMEAEHGLIKADAEGDNAAAQKHAAELEQYNPLDEMNWGQKFLAGAGKAMTDIARGGEQMIRQAVPGESNRERELNREIQLSRERDAPLMKTGGGLTGNIAGTVATALPTMFIPGVNTVTGSAAVGAGLGMFQPITEGESRIKNTAMGAAGGAAGGVLAKPLARVVSPKTDPAVKQLMKEGVTPTPGQIAGGAFKRVEEGATSVPVVGDFIRGSQRRAIEDFNRSAINRVLNPIGKTLSKDIPVGREAVEHAYHAVGSAYDDLLPKMKFDADESFVKGINTVREMAKSMPETRARQLDNIIRQKVINRMTSAGKMSGETLKQVDSDLGKEVSRFIKSQDGDQQLLGEALAEVKRLFGEAIKRNNPNYARQLSNIDEAYANLLRIENAAGRMGSKEGIFSPAQLSGAVKSMDKTLRKRGFSHGNALMQDLSESGQKVLGSSVPDSGTPFRLTNMALAGGGYYLDPMVAGAMGLGSAAYTTPAQKIAAALMTKRPPGAIPVSEAIRRVAPFAGSQYAISENRAPLTVQP